MKDPRNGAGVQPGTGAKPLRYGPVAFLVSILDPRSWLHQLRMVHYYSYSHVIPRRQAHVGAGVRIAPNATFRNGSRIVIGDHSHIGANCSLWAGDSSGRIVLGDHALLGPEVFITASNYRTAPGVPVMEQPKQEADVVVGRDVWLGARTMVMAGVHIGDGCVIGAGSVVTRSLPPGSIAVGAPARVVGRRQEDGDGSIPGVDGTRPRAAGRTAAQ